MFDWSCSVLNTYNIHDKSGVLALGFSLLDRFVAHEIRSAEKSKDAEPINRDDLQLFSMTALYLSVKLMEGHKLPVSALVAMSRGFYKAADIVGVEHEILTALKWRLHAPTAIGYCRLMWDLWPLSSGQGKRAEHEMLCAALTEVATANISFLSFKSINVAVASMVLSARLRGISEDTVNQFFENLDGLIEMDGMDSEYHRAYCHLERVYCG